MITSRYVNHEMLYCVDIVIDYKAVAGVRRANRFNALDLWKGGWHRY